MRGVREGREKGRGPEARKRVEVERAGWGRKHDGGITLADESDRRRKIWDANVNCAPHGKSQHRW